jgi:hypothetical protein
MDKGHFKKKKEMIEIPVTERVKKNEREREQNDSAPEMFL